MWTPDIVKARFVEAADTEWRLPLGGIANKGGFWPEYVHSFKDMAGWGTKRLAEEREMRMRSIPPTAAAISRHTEVMEWTAERIDRKSDRVLIWAMANCLASERSFSAWCRKRGMVRMTAYRRLERLYEAISASLRNDCVLLRFPDRTWLLQESASEGISNAMLAAEGDDAPPVSSTSMICEKAVDLLDTPEDFAAFAKHLAAVNKGRRKEQARMAEREAKRRAKSEAGMPCKEMRVV